MVKEEPYLLEEKGWGEFDMRIVLYFIDGLANTEVVLFDLHFMIPTYSLVHTIHFAQPCSELMSILGRYEPSTGRNSKPHHIRSVDSSEDSVSFTSTSQTNTGASGADISRTSPSTATTTTLSPSSATPSPDHTEHYNTTLSTSCPRIQSPRTNLRHPSSDRNNIISSDDDTMRIRNYYQSEYIPSKRKRKPASRDSCAPDHDHQDDDDHEDDDDGQDKEDDEEEEEEEELLSSGERPREGEDQNKNEFDDLDNHELLEDDREYLERNHFYTDDQSSTKLSASRSEGRGNGDHQNLYQNGNTGRSSEVTKKEGRQVNDTVFSERDLENLDPIHGQDFNPELRDLWGIPEVNADAMARLTQAEKHL